MTDSKIQDMLISCEDPNIMSKETRKQGIIMTIMYEQKRVSISSKRQFTIPQKFFTELGFDKEAICTVKDGVLLVIPAKYTTGGEFAEQILAELLAEGYEGKALLDEFKNRQSKVRVSVENMLEQARKAAAGEIGSYTFEDVFGEED